jgi:hypothetical protein
LVVIGWVEVRVSQNPEASIEDQILPCKQRLAAEDWTLVLASRDATTVGERCAGGDRKL